MGIPLEFEPTHISFADRIGEPESTEIYAALGWIVSAFSELEDGTSNMIALLSGTDRKAAHIMTAQLSFRQKLDVIASLVKHRLPSLLEPSMHASAEGQITEAIRRCQKAEELRNAYLHSSYIDRAAGSSPITRVKVSARVKHGLTVHRESLDSGLLLDVSEYITNAVNAIEELPLILEIADTVSYTADCIRYLKSDSVVVEFRFGELE